MLISAPVLSLALVVVRWLIPREQTSDTDKVQDQKKEARLASPVEAGLCGGGRTQSTSYPGQQRAPRSGARGPKGPEKVGAPEGGLQKTRPLEDRGVRINPEKVRVPGGVLWKTRLLEDKGVFVPFPRHLFGFHFHRRSSSV